MYLAIAGEEADDLVDGAGHAAQGELAAPEVAAEVHVGEQAAPPVFILNLDDVVHYEPGPDVEVPEQNTLFQPVLLLIV